jgi:flagella basal body P-ring formation protein FlgA
VLAGALVSVTAVAQTSQSTEERLRSAIEQAVVSQIGPSAAVSVSGLTDVRVTEWTGSLVVALDPAARAGKPARFILSAVDKGARTRIGEATALVTVTVDTVRVRREVPRGRVFEPADVEAVRTELEEGRFVRPPSIESVLGARAARALAPGVMVGFSDLIVERMVKSGDRVRAVVRLGGAEIETVAVAVQAGTLNDVIPVVNPGTRRVLRGRVVGSGEVEVIDAR